VRDNSARWPKYWDGRWFLNDFGNNSAKHALLLDPATDQDGGQPIYADSLRNTLSWQGNYMDSKFGPDGALYVQVYDGFFRAGPNVGLYRFDYTGGPDTPGQWAAAAVRPGDEAIGGQRQLQGHERTPFALADEVSRETGAARVVVGQRGLNPGGAHSGEARAGGARVGILDPDDEPAQARRARQVGACRPALAFVRARLEGYVKRRSACPLAGLLQRNGFGMGPPAGARPAAPDRHALAHDDRADRRVRAAQGAGALGQARGGR